MEYHASHSQKKLIKNIQENKNINNSLCEINIKESTFKSTFFNFDLEIKISSKNMFLSGEWDATSTLLANKKLIEKKSKWSTLHKV